MYHQSRRRKKDCTARMMDMAKGLRAARAYFYEKENKESHCAD